MSPKTPALRLAAAYAGLVLCSGGIMAQENFRHFDPAKVPQPPAKLLQAKLPAPPQQNEPWIPPAPPPGGRPALEMARHLFAHGLADPRGCEYREAFVGVGSCWSGWGARLAIHGWVLPDDKSGMRFIIGWNGLIYPCDSIGAPADVETDVKKALESTEEDDRWRSFNIAGGGEGARLNPYGSSQVGALLLHRLGMDALAAKLYDDGVKSESRLALIFEMMWNHLDRAICAHMSGEHALCRASAEAALGLVQATLVDEKWMPAVRTKREEGEKEELEDWKVMSAALVAEAQRRSESGRNPLTKEDLVKADIGALIEALEDVDERQWGQPGGVSLGRSPIVQELATRGHAAVAPLLECLERDQRKTRSVSFWRDFSRNRILLGVHEAAYVALASLLEADFINIASTGDNLSVRGDGGRAKIIEAVKAYIAKYGEGDPVERAYRILADDQAGVDLWSQSISTIVRPKNMGVIRASGFGGGWTVMSPTEEPASFNGESLRAKQNPSVTELMIKRHHACAPKKKEDRERDALRHFSAIQLSRWDRAAAASILETHAAELKASMPIKPGVKQRAAFPERWDDDGRNAEGYLAVLGEQMEGGQARAWTDYEALLESSEPKAKGSSGGRSALRLLGRFATEKAALECAARVLRPESPWNYLRRESRMMLDDLREDEEMGLLKLPVMRRLVLQGLDDKTEIGLITVEEKQQLKVEIDSENAWMSSADKDVPIGKSKLRVCDFVAYGLSATTEFRVLNTRLIMTDASDKRDEAIAKFRERLAKNLDAPTSAPAAEKKTDAPSR